MDSFEKAVYDELRKTTSLIFSTNKVKNCVDIIFQHPRFDKILLLEVKNWQDTYYNPEKHKKTQRLQYETLCKAGSYGYLIYKRSIRPNQVFLFNFHSAKYEGKPMQIYGPETLKRTIAYFATL